MGGVENGKVEEGEGGKDDRGRYVPAQRACVRHRRPRCPFSSPGCRCPFSSSYSVTSRSSFLSSIRSSPCHEMVALLHASRGRVGAEQIEEDGAGTEVVDVDKKTDGSRGGRGRGESVEPGPSVLVPQSVPAADCRDVSICHRWRALCQSLSGDPLSPSVVESTPRKGLRRRKNLTDCL